MMVSPEWFYEEKLKGKTVDQIKKEIRSLKREISRLQKIVANPKDNIDERMICPSPDVQLQMHSLYLKKATEVLMDTIEYQDV